MPFLHLYYFELFQCDKKLSFNIHCEMSVLNILSMNTSIFCSVLIPLERRA